MRQGPDHGDLGDLIELRLLVVLVTYQTGLGQPKHPVPGQVSLPRPTWAVNGVPGSQGPGPSRLGVCDLGAYPFSQLHPRAVSSG